MTLIQIIQITIPLIIPFIVWLYKISIDKRFTALEKKVSPFDQWKNRTEFSIEKDIQRLQSDVKAINELLDNRKCPGFDECKKVFALSNNILTREILEEVIDNAFTKFELRLMTEGKLINPNKNK